MKQIALDIGLAPEPTLEGFVPGENAAALQHLRLWTEGATRSPVPTYLWGAPGAGKTHLLRAVRQALQARGASVGWLNADSPAHQPFDERWDAVLLDDVQAYGAELQHTAFNWFVNAVAPARGEVRAVLRRAADERGLFLSDEVMNFVLGRFSRDLASLMQLLEHLDRYALQTQRAITIPLVKSMLQNE